MKKTNDKNTINPVFFILNVPKYWLKGFIAISYIFYSAIKYFFKYLLWGYIVISYYFYLLFAWSFKLALKSPKVEAMLAKRAEHAEELREIKEKRALEKQRRVLAKQEAKEQVFIRKEEAKRAKNQMEINEKNKYLNKNVKLEKHNLAWYINSAFNYVAKAPKRIKNRLKFEFENTIFYKNARNKKDIERQALLLNFEGEDAEKSEVKIVYEYIARDANGKTIKGYFDAFSKVEVHSYLLSEGYEVYSIRTSKWIQLLHGSSGRTTNIKIKIKDLIFMLTQLSTYIKAGIPLVDALKILSRQFHNKAYQKVFGALIYDLSMGDSFSEALAKQGEAFPRLLINMVKASELTGELPEALDDMSDYYTETEATRKQMISALTYPSIVFVMAIGVMTFIMLYVIPKFVAIYETIENSQIPEFTMAIIRFSNFMKANFFWIVLIVIVVLGVIIYLYKNVKVIRIGMQWLFMHVPPISRIIIFNEVTMFSKTFASLLKHTVFITDSMEILNRITSNEIYKSMILDTITNLAKGEKISKAFENSWAFPLPAYEMIVTGEKTGQLAEMMQKVSDYYQDLHRNEVARLKAYIEPILIVFLTFMVGVIVLAIIIPMFNMYSQIQMTGI